MIKLLVSQDKYDSVLSHVRSELEALAKFIDKDIFVSSGYRAGDPHEHGAALAVDVICPDLPLLDFFLAASRFDFMGMGVYPDWHMNGKLTGGLHLDRRAGDTRKLWMGVKKDEVQQYIALSLENLKLHGCLK